MLRHGLVATLCLSAGVVWATPTTGSEPAAGEALPLFPPVQFEQLGAEQGLPQIHVAAIAQDARGFLWFGTQAGGLVRYDGSRMVPVGSEGSEGGSLGSLFVTTLAADPNGLVWVGTGDAGLSAYDSKTNKLTRYRNDEKVPASLGFDAITQLEFDADGTLWVGLGNGGLDRFDAATKTFVHVVSGEFTGGAEITGIQFATKGQLLVSTNGSGVLTVSDPKGSPKAAWHPSNDKIPHDVTALLLDTSGSLWIGSESEGLAELPPASTTPKLWLPTPGDRHSLSSKKITTLREDREHRVWVGTQAGLNELDPKHTTVTRYAPDTQYPLRTTTYLQYVTAAFQDKSGTMWFGTLDYGLYKLTPLRRAFHNYAGTAEFGSPMAYCDGKDGLVWGGTYANGLYALDFKNETYRAYPVLGAEDDPNKVVLTDWLTAVHCGRDGTLWIGGSGLGLVSFNPATKQYHQYPADPEGATGPMADRIEQIVEGKDGTLWLAGWGGGLSKFDPKTKQFALITRDERVLPSAYLHRILFDVFDPNVLWVGAAQGGVARLDLRTNTSTIVRGPDAAAVPNATTLSSDSVLSLYQEPSGKLWIGTDGGGLNAYDPAKGTITKFGLKDGLPSSVIYGILRDDDNHLWLTTTKGLVRFDLATSKMVTFTSADGLGSTEFSQNAYFRSASGEFLVSTLNGFNRFDPKTIVPDAFVPPAVFTSFRVFDKERALARPIWDTPKVELKHADSVFSVGFASLSFEAPEQTHYQYMLEGFRNEWLSTEHGQITFTNLDAGNYVLNVRTINRHGVVSESPTKLSIRVAPPWWRTKAAYAVYLVLLVGAGVFIVYLQRQRLLRVEREGRLALVEQELQLTGAVQSGFLPASNDIATHQVRITGAYKPAESCSGDWWWHAQLDASRHVVLVGDVTGHGAGPAMVTAAVATAFHVFATTSHHVDIEEMLELLNREVLRVGKGQYQMTLAALELDEELGNWTLYNVGAPPILTLDANGKHKVHFCPSSLLGTAENFSIGKLYGSLASTDRILLYTDGIPEIQLPNGKMLGQRRFAQIYEQTRAQPLTMAAASLMNHAITIQGRRPQLDDWTFAMVEWVQPGAR